MSAELNFFPLFFFFFFFSPARVLGFSTFSPSLPRNIREIWRRMLDPDLALLLLPSNPHARRRVSCSRLGGLGRRRGGRGLVFLDPLPDAPGLSSGHDGFAGSGRMAPFPAGTASSVRWPGFRAVMAGSGRMGRALGPECRAASLLRAPAGS